MADIQIHDAVTVPDGRAIVEEIVAPWKRPAMEVKIKNLAEDMKGFNARSYLVRLVQKGRPSYRWYGADSVTAV